VRDGNRDCSSAARESGDAQVNDGSARGAEAVEGCSTPNASFPIDCLTAASAFNGSPAP
jgi:hypothetical protein